MYRYEDGNNKIVLQQEYSPKDKAYQRFHKKNGFLYSELEIRLRMFWNKIVKSLGGSGKNDKVKSWIGY